LTPPPDLTRQCAFDLRLGLAILLGRPDGPAAPIDVRTVTEFLSRRNDSSRNNRDMPLRNRVTPLGDVIATPARGLVYGNRGCLHNKAGVVVRRAATRRWIACQLSYRGWYQGATPRPGRFTGLFFLDDATALAAGHRPCGLCRRDDYRRVLAVTGFGGADAIDLVLQGQRTGQRPRVEVAALPDGAFVMLDDAPHLVVDGAVRRWSPGGYGPKRRAPKSAALITPQVLVPVLAAGWAPLVPFLHPSARETMPT